MSLDLDLGKAKGPTKGRFVQQAHALKFSLKACGLFWTLENRHGGVRGNFLSIFHKNLVLYPDLTSPGSLTNLDLQQSKAAATSLIPEPEFLNF